MKRLLGLTVVLLLGAWASAAEPKVLFEDKFEGKLGEGWSWLREDPKTWRMKDGALEIRVEPGVAPTVKNALLRKAPHGNAAIEVTITFTAEPTKQFEQAGITWYQGGKPVFKLVHELIDGKVYVIPGRVPAPEKTVQLRLVLEGGQYRAQFRPDAKGEFREVAKGSLPAGADQQVSIQCYNGSAESEHWIRFDDFRIVELP
jgi:hypothetical protein